MSMLTTNIEDVVGMFVEEFFRGGIEPHKKALHVSVRYQLDWYDEQVSVCKLFHFIYYSPTNYTKVYFRESEFADCSHAGEYKLVADHDSCWRDSWDDANRRAYEISAELRKNHPELNKNNVSKHVSLDRVQLLAISDFTPNHQRSNYVVKKDGKFTSITVIDK